MSLGPDVKWNISVVCLPLPTILQIPGSPSVFHQLASRRRISDPPTAECSISSGTVTMSRGLLPSSLSHRTSESESPAGLRPTTEDAVATSIRGTTPTTARSGSLTRMTEGDPPASSAKEKSSATAENSIPTTAGTSVPTRSAGAPQQKRPATPLHQWLGSVPQHHSVRKPPRSHPEGVRSSCNVLAPSLQGHPPPPPPEDTTLGENISTSPDKGTTPSFQLHS